MKDQNFGIKNPMRLRNFKNATVFLFILTIFLPQFIGLTCLMESKFMNLSADVYCNLKVDTSSSTNSDDIGGSYCHCPCHLQFVNSYLSKFFSFFSLLSLKLSNELLISQISQDIFHPPPVFFS